MGTGELSGLRDEMLDDHLAIDWHLTQAGVLRECLCKSGPVDFA